MSNARSFLFPFKYSHRVAFVVEFSHKKIRLYAQSQLLSVMGLKKINDGNVLIINSSDLGNIWLGNAASDLPNTPMTVDVDTDSDAEQDVYPAMEIAAPYTYADLWDEEELCCKIQTIQHSDVLYIFNKKYPIMVLKRYSNTDWRLEELELKNGPFLAMNMDNNVISSNAVEGEVELTASYEVFQNTDVGRLMRFNFDDDEVKPWAASLSITQGGIYYSDNKYYEAMNTGTTGTEKPVHSTGIRSDGGVRWKYLHDGSGIVKITEYLGEKKVKANILGRLPDKIKEGTHYWEMGVFHQGGNYPIAGAFFRNRFVFLANTDTGPNVYFSVNGDFNNFADNEIREATAESAITVPVLNTEFNEGKWLYAGDVLFVGTGDAEFYIDSVSSSLAMSSDNIKISQISGVGSKAIRPVGIGAHILFSDRYGLSLRDLAYNYSYDGYDQVDISILGKHLFQARIVGLIYQEVPDKILWCLMGDGSLTALTFSAEQEVAALSRHDFSGKVESVTVIPNLETCRDEVWLEICREVNGKRVRSVELLENGMPRALSEDVLLGKTLSERQKLENDYVRTSAMYLDGAVTYERNLMHNGEEMTGLDHLEGREVAVFADGTVLPKQVVKDGKIAISPSFQKVVAGLPICSQYIPQSIYVASETGSGLGQKQRINHVLLVLYLSGGGRIGEDDRTLTDIFYRPADAVMNIPQALFSGNKEVLFNGSTPVHEKAASILIENDSPLPMNILALVPAIDVEQ